MSEHSGRDKFNLSAWALAHQQLMTFLMLMILVAGELSYQVLPRNEDPAFTIKTAVVSAQWPGADLNDTVQLLTAPLEKKLQEVPYLDYVQSETHPGKTVIFVNLRDSTPPAKVQDIWYQVRKKMQDITRALPAGVAAPTVNDDFDDTFGTIYGFTAEGFSARELRDRVESIRDRLMSVPDVGKIELLGVQEEQIVASFSPRTLAGMGLSLQQVTDALHAQNALSPPGVIRTDSDNIALRVSGAFSSEQSLRNITLHINDRFIPLTDVVTLSRLAAEPPTPQYRVNGKPAIGLAISMAPTGNMLDFGKALTAKMSLIASQLPHGIEVTKVADQARVVSDAVSGFVRVLGEAIVIVLAVSFVSLGLRAGLVVAAAIPLVLAMTFTGMMLTGIGLQRISLGALIIALGLLVDDAMITVETMVARLEAGDSRWRAATVAFETTAFPMLTGTLVMIAGFIPVGFAASGAGEYCYSLFVVVLISLLSSWVVAVLFSPLTGSWMLSSRPGNTHAEPGIWLHLYRRLISKVLCHRVFTLGLAGASLVVAIWGMSHMQGEFFPASDRPELLVSFTMPANTSQAHTLSVVEQFEAKLSGNENIDHFSSYSGSGAVRFYLPMDVLNDDENIAQLVIVAKNLAARDRLKAQLNHLLKQAFSDVVTRVSPLELGPPVGWPIRYRVSGPHYDRVKQYAEKLASLLGQSRATRSVNLMAGEPERVITFAVNQTAARAAGVSSEDIAQTLHTLWSGKTITTVRDHNRLIDVVLRADDTDRMDLSNLATLKLTTAAGTKIAISQLATLQWGLQDPVMWRRQGFPYVVVQTDVAAGMQAEATSAQLSADVQQLRAQLAAGYTLDEEGTVAESDKGNSSVFAVLPVTFFAMLILLMVQLQRFSRMLLAFAMAPFGLPGIVLAMLPTGTPMGFVALLGMIALAGMIIRNAVILIMEADSNLRAGMRRNDAVSKAAEQRARPIILTACAAILGMIPISHQVFWGPMAYAIIGGLLVGTLMTLTVLPAALSLVMQGESAFATR